MNEQHIAPNAALTRIPRTGKSASYTSPLTEENLKLHTGMAPSTREAKSHHVFSYVDLQRQLVALEIQLRREIEAAQEKFNSALPENTPSVIPEIIHISTVSPSLMHQPHHSEHDEEILPSSMTEILTSPPKKIGEIPTLLDSVIKNQKKSQRIKTMGKNIVKKLSFRIEKNSSCRNSIDEQTLSSPTSFHFEKDITSLRAEPSVSPSAANSMSIKSRRSSNHPVTPLKRIFIPASTKPAHRRTDSADTLQSFSISPTSPASSIQNFPAIHLQSSIPVASNASTFEPQIETVTAIAPAQPLLPVSSTIPVSPSPLKNERSKSDPKVENSIISEYRDSGISLVSPTKFGNHSREHSFSSLLKRIGALNSFPQKESQLALDLHQKERAWGLSSSKDHEIELLAFRYPSIKDIMDNTGSVSGGDGTTLIDTGVRAGTDSNFAADVDTFPGGWLEERLHEEKHRSVFFDFNEQKTSKTEDPSTTQDAKRKYTQIGVIPTLLNWRENDCANDEHRRTASF